MRNIYPNAEPDTLILFKFDEDNTEIEDKKLELEMNTEQDHDFPGWELSPHTTPLAVRASTQLEFSFIYLLCRFRKMLLTFLVIVLLFLNTVYQTV